MQVSYFKKHKKHRIAIHMRTKHINSRKEDRGWEDYYVTMRQNGNKVITLVKRKTRFGISIKVTPQNMNENYLLIKNRIVNFKHIF